MEIISKTEDERDIIEGFNMFINGSQTLEDLNDFIGCLRNFYETKQQKIFKNNPFVYQYCCSKQNCEGDCGGNCNQKFRLRGYKFNLTEHSTVEDFYNQFTSMLKTFKENNQSDSDFDREQFTSELLSFDCPKHLEREMGFDMECIDINSVEYKDKWVKFENYQKRINKIVSEIFGCVNPYEK